MADTYDQSNEKRDKFPGIMVFEGHQFWISLKKILEMKNVESEI